MALTNRSKLTLGATLAVAAAIATTTFMLTTTPEPVPLPPQSTFILGPLTPIGNTWYDQTEVNRGKVHGGQCANPPTDIDAYTMLNYYDLPQSEYATYQRTEDAAFLDLARQCADAWWKHPWIDEGRKRPWPDDVTPAPRHAGIGGLILRAMDGRPELWDWINAYTRWHFDHWVKSRMSDQKLFYGLREGAFMLHYATWLAQVLPDSFPLQAGGSVTNGAQLRAQYLADVEAVTVNYFGRLQQADGSWRWDDFDEVETDGGHLVGTMQPFMVGLLLSAEVDVYQSSASPAVRASIVTQITKACRHLYSDGPYTTQRLVALNVNLRGFNYYYHGGTSTVPTKYVKGNIPVDWNPTNPSDVQNQRQPIGTLIEAYGFAYRVTGDQYFKSAGDDLWDSAYGATDGIRNYMDGDAKSYNQNVRRAGTWLGWTAGQSTPTPQPSVSPTVTPVPTIAPLPSPSPKPSPSPSPTPIPSPRPSPSPSPTLAPCQSTSWPSSAQGQNSKMDERRAQGCYPVRRNGNAMEYGRP